MNGQLAVEMKTVFHSSSNAFINTCFYIGALWELTASNGHLGNCSFWHFLVKQLLKNEKKKIPPRNWDKAKNISNNNKKNIYKIQDIFYIIGYFKKK